MSILQHKVCGPNGSDEEWEIRAEEDRVRVIYRFGRSPETQISISGDCAQSVAKAISAQGKRTTPKSPATTAPTMLTPCELSGIKERRKRGNLWHRDGCVLLDHIDALTAQIEKSQAEIGGLRAAVTQLGGSFGSPDGGINRT